MIDDVPDQLAFVGPHLVEMPYGDTHVKTGVYFLLDGGTIVYIGKTDRGVMRVAEHFGMKRFNRALFLPVFEGDLGDVFSLVEIERAFIRRFRPALNGNPRQWSKSRPSDIDLDAWYGGQRLEEIERRRAIDAAEQAQRDARWERYRPRYMRRMAEELRRQAWLDGA